jgi:hypothetical protein
MLVLQFDSNSETDDFEDLIALEDTLIVSLGNTSEVDGHDLGSGEMNIFVLTNDPVKTFSHCHAVVSSTRLASSFRAAYREAYGEEFTILHPVGLSRFAVS